MTALSKEMLEYQRAILELPRFVLSGITIFATASSFFVKDMGNGDIISKALVMMYMFGMIFTFMSFVYGFKIISSIISVMKDAGGNDDAKNSMRGITSGSYYVFSWVSSGCLCFWIVCLFLMAVLK